MVGYTALTQASERRAMELLEAHNRLLRPIFPGFHGKEVKAIGDSFLVEFESALDALGCAVEIQRRLHERNLSSPPEQRVRLRIGIHLGDVIHKGGDVFGDAVNISSRIEPLSDPEGVCVSRQVFDQANKSEFPMVSMGPKALKNVSEPREVYKLVMPWERSEEDAKRQLDPRRIAILPFASFSSDPNDAYFADGVTDEIISAVAGISGLSVISRTSVIGYKGTTKKVREIGNELEVGSVLEGSFKKAGNRIRVTTQLISVAEDKHLWAQNYDRELDDVFEVQSDIAKQVADALRVRILAPEKERIEKKPTSSASAYALYLKGRHFWNTRRLEDLKEALLQFRKATEEDPDFALGYAGQADCCSLLRSNFRIDSDANLERAKELAARALELDPDLAEAYTTRAFNLADEGESGRAEEDFRRAIELKPSYATARQWYALLLRRLHRWNEALEQIQRAEELDPLSPVIASNHSEILGALGRIPESLRVIETAERLNPQSVLLQIGKAVILLSQGRTKEAGECVARASETDPVNQDLLDLRGHYHLVVGEYQKAEECWKRATE
ncbi:MAG TPA: tetratricopeptide repeat protein, partial [Nitrososphaerales archaeon]|nr:tetratricopeptide repeat protein [Nitrososphaerales archaeon]